jgi:hypothetical protein
MPHVQPPDDEDADLDLDAREAARARRRDRDAKAEDRDLMRPGMGKVFKQITDSWGEQAARVQDRARRGAGRGHDRPR